MAAPTYKDVYRQVFNLHRLAVEKLPTTPVDDLWTWYWSQAEAIKDSSGTATEFAIGMLITVAEDVERRQMAYLNMERSDKTA